MLPFVFGGALLTFRMIWFNGFPFLDKKEDHSFGVPVSAVMIRDLVLLPSGGLKLDEVESILAETNFGGFPVVQDRDSKILLGYIGRTELKYAIGTFLRYLICPWDIFLSLPGGFPCVFAFLFLGYLALLVSGSNCQTERNE